MGKEVERSSDASAQLYHQVPYLTKQSAKPKVILTNLFVAARFCCVFGWEVSSTCRADIRCSNSRAAVAHGLLHP